MLVVFGLALVMTAALAYQVAASVVGPRGEHPRSLRRRGFHVLHAAHESFGPIGAFLLAALTGTSVAITVCWPIGIFLGAVEGPVDVPVFRWAQNRQYDDWVSIQSVLTQMGNRPQIQVFVLVVSVVLAVVWRKRGWWIPPLALISAYGTEKYIQSALALVVDRGHPPTTLGTYPSGGVARLVTVWGIALVLVTLTWSLSRRIRLLLWTLLAVAAYLEGYARTYLLEHWFTDVVGGWLYGALLLATFGTATTALVRLRGSPTTRGTPGSVRSRSGRATSPDGSG